MQEVLFQTNVDPLQSVESVEKFIGLQQKKNSWNSAVLLANKVHLVILLMTQNGDIIQALRFTHEEKGEIIQSLKALNPASRVRIDW